MDDAVIVLAAVARHVIAAAMLDLCNATSARLGDVELRPHQRAAADRLVALIETDRGAVLADPVGLGKTYTALAVASRMRGPIVVVAPAALREMWVASLAATRTIADVISQEALSRGERFAAGFIIVDEAHRFRSPAAKRYAALADLSRSAPMLLVSATPIQNRRGDLAAQLALFLGRRAWSMGPAEMATHVVRAAEGDQHGSVALPALNGPIPISLEHDDDTLDLIAALPPPVPAKDESLANALLLYGLVHQWSSSHAALAAALRRRRTRAHALLAALDAGRMPTRAELAAWTHLDDAVQLAFPELVAAHRADNDADVGAMQVALDRHLAGIDALLRHLRVRADVDRARANALRRVRAAHPGERVIAFCHYAETVHALRSLLANDPGVAALTASGGRVAGGRISRTDVVDQFSPTSRRKAAPADRIDLLVTTDLLSEGLNLQEASVVVHLDLPWNPARLDQRVGRVRRLGSRHETVSVYTFLPPADASRLLRIEERLREKLRVAQHTVGIAGRILPATLGGNESTSTSLSEVTAATHTHLRRWLDYNASLEHDNRPRVAAMGTTGGTHAAFIAIVDFGDRRELVADVGDGITSDSRTVLRAVRIVDRAGDGNVPVSAEHVAQALERIRRWLILRQGSDAIDFGRAASARARRDALTRVSRALARTPRYRRSAVAPLAEAARAVATAPFGEGAERILETLVRSELPDEAWLRSIVTFGELNARPAASATFSVGIEPRILAVILLRSRGALVRLDSDDTL